MKRCCVFVLKDKDPFWKWSMCIWPNEKIALWWWSQIRLTREEVKFKHLDFKGANPPHSCSPGHLKSFHLTCRPLWPYLFNLLTSRDGCTDRDSVILSFAISSPVSCPEEMVEAHPLSWVVGLSGISHAEERMPCLAISVPSPASCYIAWWCRSDCFSPPISMKAV